MSLASVSSGYFKVILSISTGSHAEEYSTNVGLSPFLGQVFIRFLALSRPSSIGWPVTTKALTDTVDRKSCKASISCLTSFSLRVNLYDLVSSLSGVAIPFLNSIVFPCRLLSQADIVVIFNPGIFFIAIYPYRLRCCIHYYAIITLWFVMDTKAQGLNLR